MRSVTSSTMATGSAVTRTGEKLAPSRAKEASSSVFWRSARIASPTPGYCTFTTTSRPSERWAAWTWPIDAAAIGRSPIQAKISSTGRPTSRSRTACTVSKGMGGASACSAADDLLVRRPVLVGDGAGVEERQELADLHGHALHVAEHCDVALGLASEPVALPLLVAGQLAGDPSHALSHGEAGEGQTSRDPSAPDAILRRAAHVGSSAARHATGSDWSAWKVTSGRHTGSSVASSRSGRATSAVSATWASARARAAPRQ